MSIRLKLIIVVLAAISAEGVLLTSTLRAYSRKCHPYLTQESTPQTSASFLAQREA